MIRRGCSQLMFFWFCFEHFGGILQNFLLSLLRLIKSLFAMYFLGFSLNRWLFLLHHVQKYRLKFLILDLCICFRKLSVILAEVISQWTLCLGSHYFICYVYVLMQLYSVEISIYRNWFPSTHDWVLWKTLKIARAAIHSNTSCIFNQAWKRNNNI